MRILIVDDDSVKFGKVVNVLRQRIGADQLEIVHEVSAATAVARLHQATFDLMLLDINLPRRLGEQPLRGGGLVVLEELEREFEGNRPRYIVGLTAYGDLVAEFGETFEDRLWSLVHYSESSNRWISQLSAKVDYIAAVRKSGNFSDGVTYGCDVAIVCALDQVEFQAVKRLNCNWEPLRYAHDETRYLLGTTTHEDGHELSLVAAAAPRMGMPAAAVLASKVIAQFRPRYLVMTGICGGRFGKVNLGDLIIADPTWDWGNGKIKWDKDKKQSQFEPSPHQLDVDPQIVSKLKDACDNVGDLANLKASIAGKKPATELKVHFGHMASGAAVVADPETFVGVAQRQRDVIAIDMEAYAVSAAAIGMGLPRPLAVTIKGVCDFADAEKDDDYQEYAANVSAAFALRALKVFPSR